MQTKLKLRVGPSPDPTSDLILIGPLEMLRVLYEDNHLLVVDKPAKIATMGSLSGESMHSVAASYIGEKYNKPGKVFIGIVSRLDTMTSGVLVLARTSKAASRLSPQFGGATGKNKVARAAKVYLAAIEGELEAPNYDAASTATSPIKLVDHVAKDDAARRMRIVGKESHGAQLAELQYVILGRAAGATLIAVRLMTGRKHQIRVQFADRGNCVWGDRKYGSQRNFASGIGLHSYLLQIDHPTLKDRREFSAPLPPSWNRFAAGLPSEDQLRETISRQFDLPPITPA